MAITATLSSRAAENGVDALTIVYSDGAALKYAKSHISNGFTDAQIEAIAQAEVAGITSASTAPGKSIYSQGSQINLVPPVVKPVVPSPEQVAQLQFSTDYQLLLSMQRGIAAGLKTAQDADYTAQLKLVQGEYLPAYVGML